MQKTKRLMDVNTVSFQMLLILCLLLHLVQKAKFLSSSNAKAIIRCLAFLFFFWGGGACAEAKLWSRFFSEKEQFIRHFARFNFSRLLLALILKYYPILHVVKR